MRHPKNFWKNKENIIEEARKYSTRSEFNKKSHRAYDAARRFGLLDSMEWMKYKNVYEDEVDSVYKYFFEKQNAVYIGRTVNPELRDKQHKTTINDSVYKFAQKNNVKIPPMEIIEEKLTINKGVEKEKYWEKYYRNNGYQIINKAKCGSIGSLSKGKWNKNKCIEESKKYSSRGEFFLHSSSAYQKALKEGWIDEMTWLTKTERLPRGYWKNRENVINEAKKYTSKEEFQKKNISAFLAAHRYGYMDDITWLIKQKQHKKGYWTYENIEKEAIKYKTKSEFKAKSPFVYTKALKLGIIDDFFSFNDYVQ